MENTLVGTEGNLKPIKEKLVIQKQELLIRFESIILRLKPYVLYRWIGFCLLTFPFIYCMFHFHKFYAIGYIAGFILLENFLKFISPKLDPDLYGNDVLPTTNEDGDYKPFIRKLPEFLFWKRSMATMIIAVLCSLVPFLDLPVSGPLLLVYFLFVALISFRQHIMHMIRNHYVPFDLGKKGTK